MIKILNVKINSKAYIKDPIKHLEKLINKKIDENNIKENQIINIEIIKSTKAIIIYKVIFKEKLKQNLYQQKCPNCNSTNISIGNWALFDKDEENYYYYCKECKQKFK